MRVDTSAIVAILKTRFPPEEIVRTATRGHALLGLARKNTLFGGTNTAVGSGVRGLPFLIGRARDYEPIELSGEAMMSIENSAGALFGYVEGQTRDAIEAMGDRLASGMFGQNKPARGFEGAQAESGMLSLSDWCPKVAAGPFLGVDRTARSELSGRIVACHGACEGDSVLAAEASARTADPEQDGFYVMHPERHERLIEQWRTHASADEDILVEYGGTLFHRVSRRSYLVYPDTECPRDEAWRIPNDGLELASAGACPHLLDSDGAILRARNDDCLIAKLGAYHQLICHQPRKFVRMLWS